MVDLVDRAQELEEIQRQDAIRRVLDRRPPAERNHPEGEVRYGSRGPRHLLMDGTTVGAQPASPQSPTEEGDA